MIHLCNTDPPYNVKVEPRSNNAIAAGLSSFEGEGLFEQRGDFKYQGGSHVVLLVWGSLVRGDLPRERQDSYLGFETTSSRIRRCFQQILELFQGAAGRLKRGLGREP